MKSLEVRTFPALHVDNLNKLTGLDLIGLGGGLGNPEVEAGVRQGRRQGKFDLRIDAGARHRDGNLRRRILGVHGHRPAGGGDDADRVAVGGESYGFAGQGTIAEEDGDLQVLPIVNGGAKRDHLGGVRRDRLAAAGLSP